MDVYTKFRKATFDFGDSNEIMLDGIDMEAKTGKHTEPHTFRGHREIWHGKIVYNYGDTPLGNQFGAELYAAADETLYRQSMANLAGSSITEQNFFNNMATDLFLNGEVTRQDPLERRI